MVYRKNRQNHALWGEKGAGVQGAICQNIRLNIPTVSEWKSYFTQAGFEGIQQEEVEYKYSVREMKSAVGGWVKLFRMTGRALWDMTSNSGFRKRGMAVGRLKDTLIRYRDTKDFTGAVLSIGTKPS